MLITEVRWLDLNELWLTWLQAGNRRPGTIRQRAHYIGVLASMYRRRLPEGLDVDDLAAVLRRSTWGPEARKSARASIRGFYGWLAMTGRIAVDPSLYLPSIRVPRAVPRPVPVQTFADAVAAASSRVRLILQLARFGGLRRGEVAQVHSDDVGADGWLTIHGKGGHIRRVPLHPVLLAQLRAAPAGWLFPSPYGAHLTADHVGVLASDALPPGWTLHTCRHRAGTDWYAVNRDILAVQQLLGHAKVSTTQLYVEIPGDSLVTAVMGVAS
jgi:integrase